MIARFVPIGIARSFELVCSAIFILCLLGVSAVIQADSERIIDYQYDDAGNIVEITPSVSTQPPVIDSLTPSVVRRDSVEEIVAIGSALKRVHITSETPGLSFEKTSSTDDRVTFMLTIGAAVPIGAHTLTFTTRLGSATAQITVHPRLPVISVSPSPLVAAIDGPSVTLSIQLLSEDIFDHTLTLSVVDPSIATVTPVTLTILAGETRSTENVVLTPVALGTTELHITSSELKDFSGNIFITERYQIPEGNNTAISPPLGIVVTEPVQPVLINRGPIVGQLSILKSSTPVDAEDTIAPLTTPLIGVARGSVITGVNPIALLAGASGAVVTVSGHGLSDADTVQILPDDGLTLDSLNVSADGDSASFSVTVEDDIAIGTRQLVLTAGGNVIRAGFPEADRITLFRNLPVIESIDPIIVSRTEKASLVVRGTDLNFARSINILPADGITQSSSFTVNSAGNIITTTIVVDELAPLGDRVITVTTDAGTSDNTASPANTLTVENVPGDDFNSLPAPPVGIVKGEEPEPMFAVGKIRNSSLGIVVGGFVSGIAPQAEAVGAEFTLTVEGQGLQDVTHVDMAPGDGITVGLPIIAADGRSLTVDVGIEPDAPESIRQVIVSNIDSIIPTVPVGADRFTVTALPPIVNTVSPIHVVIGDPAVAITVRGEQFDQALGVELRPSDGISVSAPVVNAATTSLTVTISAAAGSVAGPRVLVVKTPGGESTSIASPSNTVHIVNDALANITPLLAPVIGIDKQVIGSDSTVSRLITAPLLGIERQFTPSPVTTTIPLTANQIGIALGPVAISVSPSAVPVNTVGDLIIEGFQLDTVDDIVLNPADGVVASGPFSVSADGRQLVLPIMVAADADQTLREIVLNTPDGEVKFAESAKGRLQVAGFEPVIESIDPIQQVPGASFNLVIRGINLTGATAVTASPADGLNIGTFSVNSAGTQLTVQMMILETAEPGPHVITVTTLAGTTSTDALPSNTFTVVESQ